MGLPVDAYTHLLRIAGFIPRTPRPLAEGAFGPPQPTVWRWRPPRRQAAPEPAPRPAEGQGAFAALAGLFA